MPAPIGFAPQGSPSPVPQGRNRHDAIPYSGLRKMLHFSGMVASMPVAHGEEPRLDPAAGTGHFPSKSLSRVPLNPSR